MICMHFVIVSLGLPSIGYITYTHMNISKSRQEWCISTECIASYIVSNVTLLGCKCKSVLRCYEFKVLYLFKFRSIKILQNVLMLNICCLTSLLIKVSKKFYPVNYIKGILSCQKHNQPHV